MALRKLDMLDATTRLADLRSPPGNRLEALKGDRRGQHSIRINDRWRICFVWRDGGADLVEMSITIEGIGPWPASAPTPARFFARNS
jgi:toxin HigB-1